MKHVKFLMSVAAMLSAVVVTAQSQEAAKPADGISLVDAREKISAVMENPDLMTSVMKQLSAEDQKQFVADMNQAIAAAPGSVEEKAAAALKVNYAALKGAAKGNLKTVVAEVFATAPVEALTVINERFAEDVFNRSANPSVTYTDDQYLAIAADLMKVVNARMETAENGDVRAGFAALMMLRASNKATDDKMEDAVIALLPESARELAKKEWFTPALETGDSKSYAPMLGIADAERDPTSDVVIVIAGVLNREAMLSDLGGTSLDVLAKPGDQMPVWDAVQHPANTTMPQPVTAGLADQSTKAMAPDAATYKRYEEAKGYPLQD